MEHFDQRFGVHYISFPPIVNVNQQRPCEESCPKFTTTNIAQSLLKQAVLNNMECYHTVIFSSRTGLLYCQPLHFIMEKQLPYKNSSHTTNVIKQKKDYQVHPNLPTTRLKPYFTRTLTQIKRLNETIRRYSRLETSYSRRSYIYKQKQVPLQTSTIQNGKAPNFKWVHPREQLKAGMDRQISRTALSIVLYRVGKPPAFP